MRKQILTIMILCLSLVGYSQGILHSNYLRGTEDLSVLSSTSDQNDNTIIFGYFTGTLKPVGLPDVVSRGGRDYFLAKFDNASNLLWVKGMGSSALEFFDGASCTCVDDNIYVTGGFQGTFYYTDTETLTSGGLHDIFLAKYDTDGNNVWCVNAGTGTSFQRATALKVDKQSNILLGGYYKTDITIDGATSTTNAYKDYFYAKFSSVDGSNIWVKTIESQDTDYSGFIYSFDAADDYYIISGVFAGSVVIDGQTLVNSDLDKYDTHVFKTDLNGDVQWIRKIQGDDQDYSYTSTLAPNGDIYITGYYASSEIVIDSDETNTFTLSDNHGSFDFFIVKYNDAGTLQWAKSNGGTGIDRLIHANFFDNKLNVAGYFVDSLKWGAQVLETEGGIDDQDMFYGSISSEGVYTGARVFRGDSALIANSTEYMHPEDEGLGVFSDANNLYAIIGTNAPVFRAGADIYINNDTVAYLIIAAVGCPDITVDPTVVNIAGCYGDSTGIISIDASGGTSPYQYSIGLDYEYKTNPLFNKLPANDYLPSVLDVNGCYGESNPVTITQPTEVIISDYTITDTICFESTDGEISLSASGGDGSSYQFSIDSGDTWQGASLFSDLGIDFYDLVVKNNKDCESASIRDTIVDYQIIVNEYSITDTICFGASDGIITLDVSNGKAPYTFSSDGGTTYSASLENLEIGAYDIYVTDANNCAKAVAKDTIFDYQISLGTPTISVNGEDIDIICYDSTATVMIDVSGAKGNYMFSVDTGKTYLAELPELTPGTYLIDVKDNFGCVETSTAFTINQYDLISITDITPTDIKFNTHGDLKEAGTIIVTVTGGTSPFSYKLMPSDISQSENTFTFEDKGDVGMYTVEVSDVNNCTPVVSDEVELDTTILTGLDELQLISGKLYPNPTTGIITFELETEKQEIQLDIYSMDGKRVINQKLYSTAGLIQETIDMSDFNQGIYIIHLDRKTISNKIVLK